MDQPKIVIGLTGTLLAGKDTVAHMLKEKGCSLVVLSDIIREELKNQGIEANRITLQDMGNWLRKEYGSQVLVERALAKHKSYTNILVIDGIRNPDEIVFLRNHSKFFLIAVDAPFEVRWNRLKARNRDAELLNHDKFVIDDARDRGFNEPLTGQQVGMCLVQADFLINNDEDHARVEDSPLYKRVNEIYREILKK